MPFISKLLNLYDVAVVQEDFAYHGALAAAALHPYQSAPAAVGPAVGFGDGLNYFSRLPLHRFFRAAWRQCHGRFSDGADCLTAKGFSVAETELAPGITVDVYNLHMDAGDSPGDVHAREAQSIQLAAFIGQWSVNRPLIVAGDTNLLPDEDPVYERLLGDLGLRDACHELACSNLHSLDRVMYRSSDSLKLHATRLLVDRRFVHSDGRDLSDHQAVSVTFQWAPRLPSEATVASQRP